MRHLILAAVIVCGCETAKQPAPPPAPVPTPVADSDPNAEKDAESAIEEFVTNEFTWGGLALIGLHIGRVMWKNRQRPKKGKP